MAQAPIQVVWFKRDLRIHDHASLANAAADGPVLPLFAIEHEQWQAPDSTLRHWGVCRSLGAGINRPTLRVARQALGAAGKPAPTIRFSARNTTH